MMGDEDDRLMLNQLSELDREKILNERAEEYERELQRWKTKQRLRRRKKEGKGEGKGIALTEGGSKS